MSIPPWTQSGELPVGVHRATIAEVVAHFGRGTPKRNRVAERLVRVYDLAASTGYLARFIVFGSFVTDKPEPNDVDVFMIMEDSFQSRTLQGELAILFDHQAADAHFGASVFWVRKLAAIGGEQATIEYWQSTRERTRRGIIEIVGERQ